MKQEQSKDRPLRETDVKPEKERKRHKDKEFRRKNEESKSEQRNEIPKENAKEMPKARESQSPMKKEREKEKEKPKPAPVLVKLEISEEPKSTSPVKHKEVQSVEHSQGKSSSTLKSKPVDASVEDKKSRDIFGFEKRTEKVASKPAKVKPEVKEEFEPVDLSKKPAVAPPPSVKVDKSAVVEGGQSKSTKLEKAKQIEVKSHQPKKEAKLKVPARPNLSSPSRSRSPSMVKSSATKAKDFSDFSESEKSEVVRGRPRKSKPKRRIVETSSDSDGSDDDEPPKKNIFEVCSA